MKQRKAAQTVTRRVWRVSAHAPLGEVVDLASETSAAETVAKRAEAANTPEVVRDFGWRQSSLELSDGLEVSEEHDTVPADLWDEYFKR